MRYVLILAGSLILSLPAAAGVTVDPGKLSVVHKGSGGVIASYPDVCITPTPAGPIPIPYPNIAMQSAVKSASKVKNNGKKVVTKPGNFNRSHGDEAGTAGGVVSNKVIGNQRFVSYSFDVKFEGKSVPRSFDLVLHSDKNTPPFPVVQGPGALSMVNHDPDDVTLTITDEQGNATPLTESAVIELADGTVCIVCMQNQKLTRVLRLKGYVTFPRQPARRPVPLQRK